MNKIFIFIAFVLFVCCGNSKQKMTTVVAQAQQQDAVIKANSIAIITLSAKFDSINTLIRDNKIEKAQALVELQRIFPALTRAYNNLKPDAVKQDKWVFPVKGYSSKAIGGTHGDGYISNGYDYFLGDKHDGHPAQDIFISDKNQDSKDDRTGKFVNVRSVSNGIVVAMKKEWDNTSTLRCGKYIWIYASAENALYYYAHNNEVLVSVGQIVNAGETIATVGRTGLNAYKKRSPTHLHFMKLVLDKEFYPRPVDTYKDLIHIENNCK